MLIELYIASLCSSIPVHQDACKKASEATAKQSNVYTPVINTEQAVVDKTTEVTGKTIWAVGGIAYKGLKEKRLQYKRDMFTIQVDYKQQSGSIEYGWRF